MPRIKYRVISALFDIKPIDETGVLDFEKISAVESILNLGRKFKIRKSGPALKIKKRFQIKNQELRIMNKPQPRIIKEKSGSENLNSKFLIPDSESNPAEDLEKYLNEDMDPAVELAAIGAKVAKKVNSRPRYKPVFAKQKLEFPISNFQFPNESQNTEYEKPDVE
ncbi:MAG: hypothetical protein ABIG69_13485, partial [Bacteroidota bacterium]